MLLLFKLFIDEYTKILFSSVGILLFTLSFMLLLKFSSTKFSSLFLFSLLLLLITLLLSFWLSFSFLFKVELFSFFVPCCTLLLIFSFSCLFNFSFFSFLFTFSLPPFLLVDCLPSSSPSPSSFSYTSSMLSFMFILFSCNKSFNSIPSSCINLNFFSLLLYILSLQSSIYF